MQCCLSHVPLPCYLQLISLPPVEELQSSPETSGKWIEYSAYDSKSTLELYEALKARLEATECTMDAAIVRDVHPDGYNMWGFYQRYWRPFGELLTDMEKEGMLVNR